MKHAEKDKKTPPARKAAGSAGKRKYRIAAAAAAALVLLLALLLHGNSDSARYERYRRQASESYRNGDYDQALSDLRKAEAIRSSDEVLMLMADCYEAQGNLELALETLRQMDLGDPAVQERITALEQRRLQQRGEGQRIIAGESYDAATAELDLKGRGLHDGVLQELRQLYALTSLSLADNDIADLSGLEALGGLRTLDLSGNRIRDVQTLGQLENLRSLYLDRNPLGDLSPLYGLQELNLLSLRGVELEKEELEALSAALPHCAILTDGDKEGKLNILLSGIAFDTEVSSLNLSGLGLRDLSCLSLCTQLVSLDLSDNELTDLSPLMTLQQLEQLKLAGNQVTDLRPLIGLSSLRHLDASRNLIGDTSAVGSMPGLLTLDLSDNPIGDFSGLKKLQNLQILRLENTGLKDGALPALYGLNRLTRLALDRNEGITVEAMSALKAQQPKCNITYGTLVYTVQLGGEDFRTDVTELCVEGTELSSLFGFEKFDCLETVRLSRNRIENLSALQNAHCREQIRTLDLSFNLIEDVSPLAALSNLETLDLRSNQISSVYPLKRLTNLKKLDLTGNPLTEEQVEELRRALPDCEILF